MYILFLARSRQIFCQVKDLFGFLINLVMKMFVFNSKREKSASIGLFGMVFFSLRFMGDKTRRSLKNEMSYFRGFGV